MIGPRSRESATEGLPAAAERHILIALGTM